MLSQNQNQMVGINANALGPPQAQVSPVAVTTWPGSRMPVGNPMLRPMPAPYQPPAPVMMPKLQPAPPPPPGVFPAQPAPRVPSLVPPWRARMQGRGTDTR